MKPTIDDFADSVVDLFDDKLIALLEPLPRGATVEDVVKE